MGKVHINFFLIVYIFPRKIFLIYMRKETGKLSEKIRQIQKGNKEEIVESEITLPYKIEWRNTTK